MRANLDYLWSFDCSEPSEHLRICCVLRHAGLTSQTLLASAHGTYDTQAFSAGCKDLEDEPRPWSTYGTHHQILSGASRTAREVAETVLALIIRGNVVSGM